MTGETVFETWQRANAGRIQRMAIDRKWLGEKAFPALKLMEKQMDWLLDYSSALDTEASFRRAVDLRDVVAHLSICRSNLESLTANERCPGDDVTINQAFRLVSSAVAVVAKVAGIDLTSATGEPHMQHLIARQFLEVAA